MSWQRSRLSSRFDGSDGADPTAAMATLVDVMLVFACGLMAAIVSSRSLAQQQMTQTQAPAQQSSQRQGGQDVQRGQPLPSVPQGFGDLGSGFQAVGRVFRDPKSGKLIMVESPAPRN